jgi:salicylate hydroxylase
MKTLNGLSVAVIGGGLGGTCAALSLLQRGADVHVYEQTPKLAEVGAGIQISPNASRILFALGLERELDRIGVRPLAVEYRRWADGRLLGRYAMGASVESAFGYPYFHLHRAELLDMLLRALPSDRLHLRRRFSSIDQQGRRPIIRFEDGSTAEADLVVGADGIHSAVRTELFGPEAPSFSGAVAYRGLVPAEKVEHLNLEVISTTWFGPGRHLVAYYVAGRRYLNVVACVRQESWLSESWTETCSPEEVREAYIGWNDTVRALVDSIEQTFKWGLFHRHPLARWSKGQATLLGDSCHAMLPYMAQGAAQSIEDGAALAASLAEAGDIPAALKLYERLRRERTAHVQRMSLANAALFQRPDGPEQERRDAVWAAATRPPLGDWLYEHDAARIDLGAPGIRPPAAAG